MFNLMQVGAARPMKRSQRMLVSAAVLAAGLATADVYASNWQASAGTLSGNWSDGAHWAGGVPTASDDAQVAVATEPFTISVTGTTIANNIWLNSATATVSVAPGTMLQAFDRFSVAAGNLAIGGTVAANTFAHTGGTVNGTVVLVRQATSAANLQLGPGSAGANYTFIHDGTISNAAGGGLDMTIASGSTLTLREISTTVGSFPHLLSVTTSSTGHLINHGTIVLEESADATNGALLLNVGAPIGAASSTYKNLDNYGTVAVNGGSASATITRFIGAFLNNRGTININANAEITSLTNGFSGTPGTVSVAAGITLSTSNLVLTNGTFNATGHVVASRFVTYNGGTVNGPIYMDGRHNSYSNGVTTLNLTPGDFAPAEFIFVRRVVPSPFVPPVSVHQGELRDSGGSTTITVAPALSVTMRSNAPDGVNSRTMFVRAVGTRLNNYGTITLDTEDSSSQRSTRLDVSVVGSGLVGDLYNYGTLHSAGFRVLGAPAFNRTINADVFNDGLARIDARTTVWDFTNQAGGTLTIASNVLNGLHANSFIQTGGAASISGALWTNSVSYTGGSIAGTVTLASSPFPGSETATPSLSLASSGLSGGQFTFTESGTLHDAGLTNAVTILSGLTVRARASTSFPGVTVSTSALSIVNYGTVALEADTSSTSSDVQVSLAGQFVNAGTVNVDGGSTGTNTRAIRGSFVNDGQLNISANTTMDSVANFGTVKTNNSTITFNGAFYNAGGFISDPATNIFDSLTVAVNGYLQGGAGDVFVVKEDLDHRSTNAAQWDTNGAKLVFRAGNDGQHQFKLVGDDDAFKWGTLQLESGQFLALVDGDAQPGGKLWIGVLQLDGGIGQLANITAAGMTILYDPGLAENAYLNGQDYALNGGGSLVAVPEPGMAGLVALVAGSLLVRRRRQGRWV